MPFFCFSLSTESSCFVPYIKLIGEKYRRIAIEFRRCSLAILLYFTYHSVISFKNFVVSSRGVLDNSECNES